MRGLLMILLGCFFTQVSFAKNMSTTGVPEGFEEFFEPQTTAVDVYFGGVFRLSTLATYTPDTLTFESVDDVLSKLPIKEGAEQQLVAALSTPLAVNDGYICEEQHGCETLKPDVAELVFDESKFRVDLYINSDFLRVNSYNNLKFLPKSQTPFSYVNNLTLNVNGSSGQYSTSQTRLFGESIVSRYNAHIHSNWVVGSEQTFKFDQLYGQYDDAGYQTQVGFLNTSNRYFDFIGSQTYLGGAFGTSFNTRRDLDYISTMPIKVYIPTRSRVNIVKDNVVISSQFYDAGNHNLDTSKLPSGAYNIDIEIKGLDGSTETVNRFYVKTTSLPPADLNVYYVSAGQMTEKNTQTLVPELVDEEYFFRSGLGHRLSNNVGGDVSLAYGYDDVVLEAGLYYYNKNYTFRPKLMLANQGRYGLSLYGFTQLGGASISYNAQQLWGGTDRPRDPLSHDPHSLLFASGHRQALSVSKTIFHGVAALQFSSQKIGKSKTRNGLDLSYKRNVFTKATSRFDVTALVSTSNERDSISLGVEWRQTQDKTSHQASLTARQDHIGNQSASTDVALAYQGQLLEQSRGDQTYSADWRAQTSKDSKSIGVGGRYTNNKVRAAANIEKAVGESNSTTLYNASVSTSIVGNANSIGFGGNQSSASALVMDIQGTANESEFEVLINGRKKAIAKVGDSIVVPVRPYETYDVKLKDVGSEFIAFDDKTVKHTIYPGNVPSVKFRADKLIVIVGNLVRGCGQADTTQCKQPVGDARINGSYEWTATDSNGDFQIEVSPAKLSGLSAQTQEYSCKIKLPEFDIRESITYFETPVLCE